MTPNEIRLHDGEPVGTFFGDDDSVLIGVPCVRNVQVWGKPNAYLPANTAAKQEPQIKPNRKVSYTEKLARDPFIGLVVFTLLMLTGIAYLAGHDHGMRDAYRNMQNAGTVAYRGETAK